MKARLKRVWKWLRANMLNKSMIVYVLIAETIFWSPVIITAIFAVTINKWFWSVCVGIIAFWAGPFTPAVPLQLGLAVLIKKIVERKRR